MERVKVEVRLRDIIDPETGELIAQEPVGDLDDAMFEADWTKDPGTGKAIIMADGSEVLNPVPMAPPLGYKKEESIIDMVQRQVKAHYEMLRDDDIVDDARDVNDFGEDEDFFPSSVYEMVMAPEFPAIPVKPVEKPAADEVVLRETGGERVVKKKALKPIHPLDNEEEGS